MRTTAPEAVRRLRTSIRRLNSIIDLAVLIIPGSALFKRRQDLKSRLRALSPVRDIDITLKFINAYAPPNPSLAMCGAELSVERRRLAAAARRELGDSRNQALLKAIAYAGNFVAGQDQAGLAAKFLEFLNRALARIIKAMSRVRQSDLGSVHRLRIAFKRLRYAAEILHPALRDFTKAHLEAMRRFHSLMGQIQDLSVIESGIRRFAARRNPVVSAELAPVIEAIRRERAHLLYRLPQMADNSLSYWIGRSNSDNAGETA
ncbi:MAG: CHAD domain-containing protein [Candidatus Edwardsbacteria bacterium]|nr:CHAD domain-containing protein [Candidatus Edwardsbacteria bacterium]